MNSASENIGMTSVLEDEIGCSGFGTDATGTGAKKDVVRGGRVVLPTATIVLFGTMALLVGLILLGSHGLRFFDFALTPYAVAIVIGAGCYARRTTLWVQRPPTRRLFLRAFECVRKTESKQASVMDIARILIDAYLAQNFIRRRGLFRWMGHLLLAGGTVLGFALTFPLVLGWIHFETPPTNAEHYRVLFMGVPTGAFPVHSIAAWFAFNALNISAVMVLSGVGIATIKRFTHRGEFAARSFWEDSMPLLLLAAIAATGLGLTASSRLAAGAGYTPIVYAHMFSVVGLLVYMPYGKFLHIAQRSAHLASTITRKRDNSSDARCARCAEPFAPAIQITDLKQVLGELGMEITFQTGGVNIHYQDICPKCRRALLAINQGTSMREEKYRR